MINAGYGLHFFDFHFDFHFDFCAYNHENDVQKVKINGKNKNENQNEQ